MSKSVLSSLAEPVTADSSLDEFTEILRNARRSGEEQRLSSRKVRRINMGFIPSGRIFAADGVRSHPVKPVRNESRNTLPLYYESTLALTTPARRLLYS